MTCNCPKAPDTSCNMEEDKDYSKEATRMESYAYFPNSCPISAPTLARAGFYYTGIHDRVECFSCKAIAEGWQHGDTVIGKHRKISPSCKFINAYNSRSELIQTQEPTFQNLNPHLGMHSASNDRHKLDSELQADFLLRTGSVVDESKPKYPKYLNMCSEEARLKTFTNWPSYVRVTPKDLANAGLFYTDINDQVKCFCCGGKLMNWEPGDIAWNEHGRHFPDCFFVLGRDVGNISLETSSISFSTRRVSEVPERPAMSQYKVRLDSFANWTYPINKEMLSKAGFYNTGKKIYCCYRMTMKKYQSKLSYHLWV